MNDTKVAEAKRAIADGFTYTLTCPHCGESAGFDLDADGHADYAARLANSEGGLLIQRGRPHALRQGNSVG